MPRMPSEELRRLRDTARRAALEGGRVIEEAWEGSRPEAVSKAAGDYVTDVDHASEDAIRSLLSKETPEVPVVGEEGGGTAGAGGRAGGRAEGRHWLVDPLDGTTNFVHRFPVVAVSVALMEGTTPLVGCVHAPILGTSYTAARGMGAEQDGRALRVSARGPDRAIVGTGFPFRRKDLLPRYEPVFQAALRRFEDLRRPGAVAMDLAWVASGAYDGFFELALSPWDLAAGALLIEEAGGVVTDWEGGDRWLEGNVVAGNLEVHAELLRLLHEAGRRPR